MLVKFKFIFSSLFFTFLLFSNNLRSEEFIPQPRAFPLDEVIWENFQIPVCWDIFHAKLEYSPWNSFFPVAQNAVRDTWQAHSLIEFTGWEKCPNGFFPGIRISISNIESAVYGLGDVLLGLENEVFLDFALLSKKVSLGNKSISEKCSENNVGYSDCVKFTVIHEFGHILGFSHEQNRADDPNIGTSSHPLCFINDPSVHDGRKIHGNVYFTDWDPNSIMNYCNENYFGQTTLSSIDIMALQAYYGRIPSYNDRVVDTFEIPNIVLSANDVRRAVLRQRPNDNKYDIVEYVPTTLPSKAPAIYNANTNQITLPLVKILTDADTHLAHISALYSGTMQYHPEDNTVSFIEITLKQPLQ